MNHKGQPTVILAHTVKGYGMGQSGEAKTKRTKSNMDIESIKGFRDRFDVPIRDEDLARLPYYRPDANSPEIAYMRKQREKLGGVIPQRNENWTAFKSPDLDFSKRSWMARATEKCPPPWRWCAL